MINTMTRMAPMVMRVVMGGGRCGDGAVRGGLSSVQNSAAGGGTLYKRVGEPRNDGMGEAFFGHTALDVGNMFGELFCEFIYTLNHGIGRHMQLFG